MRSLHLSSVSPAVAGQALAAVLVSSLDTSGGLVSVVEMLDTADCYRVEDDQGQLIGHYALDYIEHAAGREAVVVAAAGRLPGVDLISSIWPALVGQARAAGAVQVSVNTRRRGLLAKLRPLGFEFSGYIMRKKL